MRQHEYELICFRTTFCFVNILAPKDHTRRPFIVKLSGSTISSGLPSFASNLSSRWTFEFIWAFITSVSSDLEQRCSSIVWISIIVSLLVTVEVLACIFSRLARNELIFRGGGCWLTGRGWDRLQVGGLLWLGISRMELKLPVLALSCLVLLSALRVYCKIYYCRLVRLGLWETFHYKPLVGMFFLQGFGEHLL